MTRQLSDISLPYFSRHRIKRVKKFSCRGEALLRNTCANGILVNKSTIYNCLLKGHDTINTTDNKSLENKLTLVHLYTSKKRYNISFA